MQNGILLVAGIVFALMEWSYSREITRYETEKESVATEWVSSSNSNCFKQKLYFFFFFFCCRKCKQFHLNIIILKVVEEVPGNITRERIQL